jgi:hypothetical protein
VLGGLGEDAAGGVGEGHVGAPGAAPDQPGATAQSPAEKPVGAACRRSP